MTRGQRFLRAFYLAVAVLIVAIAGDMLLDGWWVVPFWIGGVIAAVWLGLVYALGVIFIVDEMDMQDDRERDQP